MLNQIVLVGRLVDQPKEEEKGATITLAVPRNFKNGNGEYETDFISARIFNDIAKQTCEYCKKGDLIGIKGKLQSTQIASGYTMELIAEKITFLSSNKDLINKED